MADKELIYKDDARAAILRAEPRAAYCIDRVKPVDAVEVVRCKDCTQWCRNIGIADSPNGHCYYHEIEMNGFDFCSYGERRCEDERC